MWNTLVVQSKGNGSGVARVSDWTSQLRRGVLELCVLQMLRREPSYGYEIVTTLNALGPLSAGENTVYPLLRRLRADGLLDTFIRESPNGPPRQYLPAHRRRKKTVGSVFEGMGRHGRGRRAMHE